MSSNRPGYIQEYYHKIRTELIKQFGGKCQHPTCHETENLEFAHRKPNDINGRGRGRQKRYQNIRKNPQTYILLCVKHHQDFDNGLWKEEVK